MLAPKHTLSTLVIALVVLISFTVQNPEHMALNAAYSPLNDMEEEAAPPIQDSELISPSPPQEIPAESPGERAEADKTARSVSTPSTSSAPVKSPSPVMPDAMPQAAPYKTPNATPKAAPEATPQATISLEPSQEVVPAVPDSEKAPSASSSAPPVKKPVKEYIGEGDDPVANVKKVNLASSEIMKIKERFELLAASDEIKPDWKRKADQIIVKGMDFLGTPYIFGAKAGQTESFDCSSFLQYLFANLDVKLPRDSRQQSQRGTEVSIDELREGDLVFFTTPKRKSKKDIDRIGHVAVYIGNGLMLHTFRPGIGVTVSELDGAWKDRFIKAKRVLS